MNEATLKRLEPHVIALTRKRAAEYVDAVKLLDDERDDPSIVEAMVEGTLWYDVVLQSKAAWLMVFCTCPYYQKEAGVCKHIWATLLRLEIEDDPFGESARTFTFGDPFAGQRALAPPPIAATPHIYKPQGKPGRWRGIITAVAAGTRMPSSDPVAAGTEILFVINTQKSGAHVEVELWKRAPRKDGGPGVPKAMILSYDQIDRLPEPDRELISPLLGTRRFAFGHEPVNGIALTWPASFFVLRNLAATGRLHLLERQQLSSPLVWDDGAAWQLAIDMTPSPGGYRIRAWLERNHERMEIEEASVITPGGLAITDTHVHCIEDENGWAWANALRNAQLEVPAAEAREFVRAVATSPSRPHWNVPAEFEWKERRVKPKAILRIRRGYEPLRGDVVFDYAGSLVPYIGRSVDMMDNVVIVRDRAAEAVYLDQLWEEGFRSAASSISIPQRNFERTLRPLLANGWRIESDGKAYSFSSGLALRVTAGIDWFDLEGDAMFGEQSVELPALLAAMENNEHSIELPDGTIGVIDPAWKARLEPFARVAGRTKGAQVRFATTQLPLVDALLASRPEVGADEALTRARKTLHEIRPAAIDAPPTFTGTLRHYQREALGWFAALRDLGFGGCLADDMGLGKTVEVLAMLDARREAPDRGGRPSLIVMPRSLIFNWKLEAARFTPQLRLLDVSGDDRAARIEYAKDPHLLLTTYGILRRDPELFASLDLDYAILDEAQAVKNAMASVSKASRLLKARHRLALSGTPVENRISDLVSIFQFINPGMLSAPGARVSALAKSAGGRDAASQESRELLAKAVRPFVLRRTKAQVAPELPERVEKTIYCELSPKERRDYDELRDHYRTIVSGKVKTSGLARSKMHILEALLRLRQAACHPALLNPRSKPGTSSKFEMLLDELTSIVEEGHKAIIFSQFTSLLALLERELELRGYAYAYLDGSTRNRQEQVDRFQGDPETQLFLISLKAGGVGLNLTAAEYVFLLDPWWNPAVEAQAIDRTHRIGQTRTVFAYRLVARDTIEEKILQLQASKRELAEAIISEDNSVLRGLTEADIELLLS